MPDPSRLRDSTQIVVPCRELAGVREELCEEFTVTVVESALKTADGDAGNDDDADADTDTEAGDADGKHCRIVGSPTVIKAVGDYLARRGVSLP